MEASTKLLNNILTEQGTIMKNLFSAYNNSSIKTTLTHRFALIGILTPLSFVLSAVKLNEVETERDNIKK